MPPADLSAFEVLRNHGVPFVIVGGHAVNHHGFARVTEDSDAVWLRSPDSERAMLSALQAMDAAYIGNTVDPQTGIEKLIPVSVPFIRAHHLMMLVTRHGFLDLFDYIPGLPDEDVGQLFDTATELDGLRYVSLAWLRRMKTVSGRTKDLLDLQSLPE
jgi:hypothetical protein